MMIRIRIIILTRIEEAEDKNIVISIIAIVITTNTNLIADYSEIPQRCWRVLRLVNGRDTIKKKKDIVKDAIMINNTIAVIVIVIDVISNMKDKVETDLRATETTAGLLTVDDETTMKTEKDEIRRAKTNSE